jgi:hypothetical protein
MGDMLKLIWWAAMLGRGNSKFPGDYTALYWLFNCILF